MSDYKNLGQYSATNDLLNIPYEVVKAAALVNRWAQMSLPRYRNITICGVGARTFLTVIEMVNEFRNNIRIIELRVPEAKTPDQGESNE